MGAGGFASEEGLAGFTPRAGGSARAKQKPTQGRVAVAFYNAVIKDAHLLEKKY